MPDRTLILLRHAKSDWSAGLPDLRRPLSDRGRRQAPEAGRWLAAHAEPIDLAVVSPARRAGSTWELTAAELTAPPPIRTDDRVYAASDRELLTVLRALPSDAATVVLVGHNPGLEELVNLLTGEPVPMPTSALAVLTLEIPWSSLRHDSAALRASGRPPA
jgi:phosphohistidine phosphatase